MLEKMLAHECCQVLIEEGRGRAWLDDVESGRIRGRGGICQFHHRVMSVVTVAAGLDKRRNISQRPFKDAGQ